MRSQFGIDHFTFLLHVHAGNVKHKRAACDLVIRRHYIAIRQLKRAGVVLSHAMPGKPNP